MIVIIYNNHMIVMIYAAPRTYVWRIIKAVQIVFENKPYLPDNMIGSTLS